MNLLSADKFFDGEDKDVSRDISTLSYLLNGFRKGPPHLPSEEERRQLEGWTHIATILSIPNVEQEQTSNLEVAVTGRRDPDSISVCIFTRKSSGPLSNGSSSKHGVPLFEIQPVHVQNDAAEVGQALLENYNDARLVDFEQHLKDIINISRFLLSDLSHDNPVLQKRCLQLTCFSILRTYPTMFSWIRDGYRSWTNHPIYIIHDAYTNGDSTLDDYYAFNLDDPFVVNNLASRLSIFPVVQEELEYEVGPDNVLLWTRLFVMLLDGLKEELGYPEPKQPGSVEQVYGFLRMLQVIIHSGILRILITEKLSGILLDSYRRGMKDKEAEAHTPNNEEYEEDSRDYEMTGEPTLHRRQVIRYLERVTAPYSAAQYFVRMSEEGYTSHTRLRVFRVDACPLDQSSIEKSVRTFKARCAVKFNNEGLSDRAIAGERDNDGTATAEDTVELDNYVRAEDGDAVGEDVKEAEEATSDMTDMDKALAHIDKVQKEHRFSPSVHAEAALMTLVTIVSRTDPPVPKHLQNLRDLFDDLEIPIGVRKKCCFCCDFLSEHLNKDQDSKLEFVLPGTNSIIYPWVPPPKGVPIHILVELRARLFEVFQEVVLGRDVKDESDQAVPASPIVARMKREGQDVHEEGDPPDSPT